MSIKEGIGHDNYERIRRIISASFPDTPLVTDDMVDDFVRSMWRHYTPEFAELGVPPPGPVPFGDDEPPEGPEGLSFPLYIGHARHTRMLAMGSKQPMQSDFIGHLPMVRVGLPPSISPGTEEVIKTQIGDVLLSADHLVGSIDMIAEKYADKDHLGYRPERVDLVTPARLVGARFGAIALYLGYRGLRDPVPSFYLLEAGTAPGVPKVLFFGKTIDSVITQTSWYKPTPFSKPESTYKGWLTLDGAEPVKLVVEDTDRGGTKPYINVTVEYERVAKISPPWPTDLILEAAQRVAAIAAEMGVPSEIPLQPVMAALGRTRSWLQKPRLGVKSSQ